MGAGVRRLMVAAIVAVAATAVVPALATADVYCVNAPACPFGGVDEHGNLQQALNDAGMSLGTDTVLVGDNGSAYDGPFHYGSAKAPWATRSRSPAMVRGAPG